MKLKTLNDIETVYGAWQTGNQMINGVNLDELKAEAIKWVKGFTDYDKDGCFKYMVKKDMSFLDWMEFFNITEGDLE